MTKAREIAELGQKLTVDGSGNLDIAGDINTQGFKVADGTSGQIDIWSDAYNIQGGSNFGDMRFNAPRFRFYEDSSRTFELSGGNAYFFGSTVFNEDGGDKDFRVESDTNTHALFVDAGLNVVTVGNSSPENWYSGYQAFQVGLVGAIASNETGSDTDVLQITSNAYLQDVSTLWKFMEDSVGATRLQMQGQDIQFYMSDAAGAANSTVTWHSRMRVDTGGTTFNEVGAGYDFRVESDNYSNAFLLDAGLDRIGMFNGSPRVKLDVYGDVMPEAGDAATVEDMLTLYKNGSATVWAGGATLAVGRYNNSSSSSPNTRLDFKLKHAAGSNTALPETNVMTLQSNGAVGIGTQAPGTALHLYSGSQAIFRIEGTGVSGAYIQIRDNDTTSGEYGWIGMDANSMRFYSNNTALTIAATSSEVSINDGSRNMDFRVESDLNTHALFVDASSRMIGIEQNAPAYLLDVGNGGSSVPGGYTLRINSVGDTIFSLSKANQSMMSFRNDGYGYTAIASNNGSKLMLGYSANDAGAISNHLYFQVSETIVNDGGIDRDFRVETDTNANALFVDAGNNSVKVGGTSDSGSGAYRAELAVNGTYGQVYGNVSTWIVTVAMGGGQTVTLGTYTGDTGASISAHLVGHHHYSTGSSGTSAPLGVYQIMSAMRKAGTSYTVINNQVVDSFTQGGASVPSLEFDNSNGQLKVVTAVNQGCYAEIRVVFQTNYQGAWTPSY